VRDGGARSRTVDYVREEVAEQLIERMMVRPPRSIDSERDTRLTLHAQDIKRKFNTILDLGSGPGHFARLVESETAEKVVMVDSSSASAD